MGTLFLLGTRIHTWIISAKVRQVWEAMSMNERKRISDEELTRWENSWRRGLPWDDECMFLRVVRELRELRVQRIKDQVAFLQTDEKIREIQNSYERACGRIETLQTEARQRFEMEQQLRAQLAEAQKQTQEWKDKWTRLANSID
jgi:hypothetical protein